MVGAMASRMYPVALLTGFSLCLALAGCGDDEVTGMEEGEVGDGDGDGDATTEGENTTTGEDPSGLPSFPATGISITHVEANQGTEVRIAEAGEWVDSSGRYAPLVKNRNTLVRVHYDLDQSFAPREIEARLLLSFADGSEKAYTQIKMVDGPSTPNALSGTFFFGLIADDGDVIPEMEFKVELHELGAGAGGGEAAGVWQSPPEPESFGIQAEPVELKIVLVPYHHIYEGIDRTTDTSDETLRILTDYLYEHNPVETLEWELHETIEWDLPMDNLGSVLGPLAAMRDNELAFPNVYYHAVFPVPGGGVAGVAGIASVPGPGKGEGDRRVSATALGSNPLGARGTLVHEVGHNEGLQHVYCPFADAASPDPTYPFENGVLGTWGFGILSFELYPPENHYDYMSYCGPSWASRWSFTKTFERARVLTSWDYQGAGSDGDDEGFDLSYGPRGYAEKPLLYASISGDGSEFWWTGHGLMPESADVYGDDYDHYLELRSEGEVVELLPAVIRYTNDYSTAWMIAELPESLAKLEGIDEIARVDEIQTAHIVPVDRVQLSRR